MRVGAYPRGGNLGYGYRRNGHGVEIHAAEADVVRTILQLADVGRSTVEIASALNVDGLARRNGKPWTHRQVAAILARRESYQGGIVRYGDVTGYNSTLNLFR